MRARPLAAAVAVAALLVTACTGKTGPGSGGTGAPAGTPAPAGPPLDVQFVERHAQAGITFHHTDGSSGKYFIVETLASGVLLFDFDGDGKLDIYFVNGRPLPPSEEGNRSVRNALYRQEAGGKFTDVTLEKRCPGTGFGAGGAAADIDGDGDLDMYVCQFGPNALYRNEGKEGGWAFTDVIRESGADDPRFSAGACFFDMDRDGDLDLYVTNYCKQDFSAQPCYTSGIARYCAPSQYEADGDSLFLNLGDGKFRNVTAESGVGAVKPGRGMGVIATDYDLDGWPDIYVANDGSENFLFHNLKDGKFKEVGLDLGVALSGDGDEQGSMGVDSADFDRDGRFDLFCTNFHKQLNALYRYDEKTGTFFDVALAQGLGESTLPLVKWGTKFFDFDHDMWLDLFIVNGHLEDKIETYDNSSSYKQPRQLYRNMGGGVLKDVTSRLGKDMQGLYSSRGAAFGDIDNDGDVDIVVCNSREEPSLYYNEGGNRKSWILIQLEGKRNRFGVGALVRVTAKGVTQMSEVHSGASYVSQNDLRLHFGLDDADKATVEVRWPEGLVETFRDLEARKLHRLVEGTGTPGQ